MSTYDYILQKYGLRPKREYAFEIPNIGRNDIASLLSELQFTKAVEIGVDKGEYSELLAKSNPTVKVFGVDPYKASAYEPGSGLGLDQKYFNDAYNEARKRLRGYKNYTLLRMTSQDALRKFSDSSLDFVYIDGNPDFVSVTNDIHSWLKKIKPGGILAGSSYAMYSSNKNNHMKRVVDNYMVSYHMLPYFIAGAYDMTPGTVRDKYRSWFWVKQTA